MTEHPILFSGEMVRGILDGRKTQTRRVVSPHTSEIGSLPIGEWHSLDFATPDPRLRTDRMGGGMYLHVPRRDGETVHRVYSRIEPGDRLWVRETWTPADHMYQTHDLDSAGVVAYRADRSARRLEPMYEEGPVPEADLAQWNWDAFRWRPSIHMPRWACRLVLEVTDVRVERLQDITEEDAKAEGVDTGAPRTWQSPDEPAGAGGASGSFARPNFRELWDSINAKRGYGWDTNPWVWVVTFERVPAEDRDALVEGGEVAE